MVTNDEFREAFGLSRSDGGWSRAGKVVSLLPDGGLAVSLDGSSSGTRCEKWCAASVGDVVLVEGVGRRALATAVLGGGAADRVVERTTSGGWEVVRWESGRMEQRRRFTLAAGSYTWDAWGSLYETSEYAGGGAYPVAFAERPSVSVGHVAYGYGSISGFEIANNGSATACPRVYPLRPAAGGGGHDITFEVAAVGRWKE